MGTIDRIIDRLFPNDPLFTPAHPFHTAARDGQIDVLKSMLDGGVPVDLSEYRGHTALMSAAASRRLDSVRLLLRYGANPNARQDDGSTPLIFAVGGGSRMVIRELLEAGADPKIQDRSVRRYTALINAVRSSADPETIRILLKAGADPNARDPLDGSVFVYAYRYGNRETIRLLNRFGAIL